ncbi:MAG: hypothetical protein N2644_05845 [Candidatus Sumerlaea chitinivorans]|uniref:Uncharacterized protein n=1 Tax=Sumerlaea chitinivorans TaxID=2250252 RepID=A0A2Z4Y575_SUMC1|nr:hypothetical protein BRCON_1095 [Candidatus Sumerlaea chitinivorans]MCX7963987.1 hypothetical protein [Candidatus Sumerlaea chitinivorans]
MRSSEVKLKTQRGTTMLYLVGALAVLTILMFGLAESHVRSVKRVAAAVERAQAEWLARGAVCAVQAHASDRATTQTSRFEFESGVVEVSLLNDGAEATTQSLVVTAHVPAGRPRVSVKRIIPVPSP